MQLYWSRGFSPAVSGKQFNTREKMGMRVLRKAWLGYNNR